MKKLPPEELTLPLTFEKFLAAYHTNCNTEDSVQGYIIYLESNEWLHRYGRYDNYNDWLQDQLAQYLKR